MDINWEPTAEDFTLGETASTLNLLLYLTLFGTSAHLINKVTVAEQLIYRGITLSKDWVQNCIDALTASRLGTEPGLDVMSNSYFYLAVPKVVLTKATAVLIKKLASNADPDYVFNTMRTLVLETSGLNQMKDWLGVTNEKNLHFTARGALLMALDNFKNLAPNSRDYFATQPIVLLLFRVDVRNTLNYQNLSNIWLWNRHYWEHSYAFNFDDWTFNLHEFNTMKTFVLSSRTLMVPTTPSRTLVHSWTLSWSSLRTSCGIIIFHFLTLLQ